MQKHPIVTTTTSSFSSPLRRPGSTRIGALFAVTLGALALACDEPSDTDDGDPFVSDVDELDGSEPGVAEADGERAELDGSAADGVAGARLARLSLHGFRRYLAGFPGGTSELEERLADAIAEEGLTDEDLRGFVARAEGRLAETLLVDEDEPAIDLPLTAARLEQAMARPQQLAAPLPEPLPADCPAVPPFDTLAKYRLKLEGIGSVQCSGDVGDPQPCADEEVFAAWTLFTPTARWSGLTNVELTVSPTQALDRFNSGNAAPSATGTISSDMLLVYRVFEQDGDYYTESALIDTKAASVAVWTAMIDWKHVALYSTMQTDLRDLYDVLSKSNAGADDSFALKQVGTTEKRMWEITNGCILYPESMFPFNVPSGDYYKMAMRIYTLGSHFKTWLTFNRI